MQVSKSLIPLSPRPLVAHGPQRQAGDNIGDSSHQSLVIPDEKNQLGNLTNKPGRATLDLGLAREKVHDDFLRTSASREGLSYSARQAIDQYADTSEGNQQSAIHELLGVDVFV